MSLSVNLRKAFNDNLNNKNNLEQSAKSIVDAYKKSVQSSKDILGNSYTGLDFKSLEKSIISSFELSLNTGSPFNFSLIIPGLIKCWSTATVILPAIAPGFSLVTTSSTISSSPTNIPIAPGNTQDLDKIIKSFETFFSSHAKTIVVNYIGLSTSVPPVPLVLPVTGVILT